MRPTQQPVRKKTGMLKVHPDRPALEIGMVPEALDQFYWYMEELVAFCRAAGLATAGHKHEVIERVRRQLQHRAQPDLCKVAVVARKKTGEVVVRKFGLDEPIGPNYKCDAETRAFFESVIGPHFHFTAHLQRFRRARAEQALTYGDLAREWVEELERRKDKSYTPTIMHTWEYNTFVRDYMRDKQRNAGKTMKDAAAAWNAVRQSCGPRDYASSIACAAPPPG
ncbi:DUF6434 domain-containing protein [Undibacterium sp. CCC3.4]|uniref:DUF6434 domain-containing protein n=2 Tax=Undibacterium TaxID=401469 RepID=UPI002B229119|nr:DUF6434 domain-containing protein [Undibacterium sp. CCC3.4]